MTGFTPNFAIPYPQTADPENEFAAQMLASATAIDAALSTVSASEPRLVIPPVSRMSLRTPVVIPLVGINALQAASLIFYDTVDLDTANLTNLGLCPVGPLTPAGLPKGWYDFGIYLISGTTNASSTGSSLMVQPSFGPQVVQTTGSWPLCFGANTGCRRWDGGSSNTSTTLCYTGTFLLNPAASTTLPAFTFYLIKQGNFGGFTTGAHAFDQLINFACVWMAWSRDQ